MKLEILVGITMVLLLLVLPAAASDFTHGSSPDRRIAQQQFT